MPIPRKPNQKKYKLKDWINKEKRNKYEEIIYRASVSNSKKRRDILFNYLIKEFKNYKFPTPEKIVKILKEFTEEEQIKKLAESFLDSKSHPMSVFIKFNEVGISFVIAKFIRYILEGLAKKKKYDDLYRLFFEQSSYAIKRAILKHSYIRNIIENIIRKAPASKYYYDYMGDERLMVAAIYKGKSLLTKEQIEKILKEKNFSDDFWEYVKDDIPIFYSKYKTGKIRKEAKKDTNIKKFKLKRQ